MESIESWGAVIGIVAYLLFKFVGKVLNSPIDTESPVHRPEAENTFPELNQDREFQQERMITFQEPPAPKKRQKRVPIETSFGEEIVEAQLPLKKEVLTFVEQEQGTGVQLDFTNYDEIKRGLIYSEIFQRKY